MGYRWHFSLSHLFGAMAIGGAILAMSRVTELAQFFGVVLALVALVTLWALIFGRPA